MIFIFTEMIKINFAPQFSDYKKNDQYNSIFGWLSLIRIYEILHFKTKKCAFYESHPSLT